MKRNGGQNGNDVVRTNFPCPMCWEGSNLFLLALTFQGWRRFIFFLRTLHRLPSFLRILGWCSLMAKISTLVTLTRSATDDPKFLIPIPTEFLPLSLTRNSEVFVFVPGWIVPCAGAQSSYTTHASINISRW